MNQLKNTNSPVILIADDDRDILSIIETILQEDGYQTLTASDGEQAVMLVQTHAVQLLILDIMMPKMNGLQAATQIRRLTNAPILMLSAKGEQSDRVIGLNMGADDYLVKPFFRDELLARVHSLLRRYLSLGSASDNSGNLLQYYELTLNTELKKLYVRGDEVRLTATEYKIMFLLLSRPGRIFPAEEIYERVWEQDSYSVENTVMIHINRLRKKIELNPKKPEYLKVVWGIGYKIEK